jgi:hypothetical protein
VRTKQGRHKCTSSGTGRIVCYLSFVHGKQIYRRYNERRKEPRFSINKTDNIPHPFTEEKQYAGKALFLRHHISQIRLRKTTGTSFARAEGFNRDKVNQIFDLFKAELDKECYPAHRMFIFDEIGLCIMQTKVPGVIDQKSKASWLPSIRQTGVFGDNCFLCGCGFNIYASNDDVSLQKRK